MNALGAANGDLPLTHGIEEAQFFDDGQRGKAATIIALAGKNLFEVEGHGDEWQQR